MKLQNIIYLIVLIVIIIFYCRVSEGFTNIDYGTGIGPWWAQGAGLNRGFHRCICYGSGECRCINNKFNKLLNTSIYPQYYFN
jgi:hypothetical protein